MSNNQPPEIPPQPDEVPDLQREVQRLLGRCLLRLQQYERLLKELVDLRNGLVHHFIEQYDLWQPEGCIAAQAHLLSCHARIDEHCEQLRAWVEAVVQARQLAGEFMQSPAFHDLLIDGIALDGMVQWAASGSVRALREAILALAVDGWASVDAAAHWISTQYPDQTPEKYGCRNWRQVIHESRRFDLRYRDEDGRKQAWYQERTKVQKVGR